VRHPIDTTDHHVGARVRMRRLMLDMSQTTLADSIGVTFQQVQKYEKGTNRISASKLQQIASVLQVPIPFFFEGLPSYSDKKACNADALSLPHVKDFLATTDGLSLVRAYMQISNRKLRQALVQLVEDLAPAK
jgi:transcriptional regulator with XRE-family HTH domain